MSIEWNKVTWYSKLAAVIVGLGTIALGYYFYSEFKKVGEIVPTQVADWKTYRNEKYGFEFQYPVSWKFSEFGNAGEIYSPDFSSEYNHRSIKSGTVITVADYGETYRDDSVNTLNELVKIQTDDAPNIKVTFIKVNGSNAVQFKHSVGENNNTHDVILIVENGREYIINQQYKKNSIQPYNEVLDQIISTFKFTK